MLLPFQGMSATVEKVEEEDDERDKGQRAEKVKKTAAFNIRALTLWVFFVIGQDRLRHMIVLGNRDLGYALMVERKWGRHQWLFSAFGLAR